MTGKDHITRLTIILSVFLAGIIWKPIFIFTMPGILILFLPAFKEIDLIDLIIYALGISISFWICSFWFLKYIALSLMTFFMLVASITTLTAVYCLFRKIRPYRISLNYYNFILIILFLFVMTLRFIPMNHAIVPAGADMSMHTYITNLIANANGIPDNYYPILGINKFNTYPAGFHTISALVSLIGNIPGFRATFIVSCLTYLFITLFLFVFLRKFVSWEFAFVSTICFSFFTGNPQGFSSWGGTPTIFALALFILFISFLDRIQNNNKWFIFFSAISLVSLLLSSTIVFIQSFYIFGFSFLIYFLLKKEYKGHGWIKYLLITILFFIIAAPYLINSDYGIVTSQTLDWIKNWVKEAGPAWQGTISNFMWTIPLYIKNYVFGARVFKYFLFICTAGFIFLWVKKPKRGIKYFTFLILSILLILNAKYWVLPFSYAIYPERVATMAIIPLSLFFAYALEVSFKYLENKKIFNKKFLSIIIFGLITFIMVSVPVFNKVKYTRGILNSSSVTGLDLKAFDWLKKHTNATDVIQNNYGDGGLWIPSIISRPITNAHINVIYLDKTKSLGEAKYVYIGKKCVYGCEARGSDFEKDNRYELVYSNKGVYIYKIVK